MNELDMPYRNLKIPKIVLNCFPMLAALALIAVPISFASGKLDNKADGHGGKDSLQDGSLFVDSKLASIGLLSPLGLPFERVELRNTAQSENTHVSREQYRYEQNGVSITVSFVMYATGLVPTVEEITQTIVERLMNAPGLELVDFKYDNAVALDSSRNEVTGMRTIFHSAKYLMQPFSKEIHYEVRNYLSGNQHWMITASYKSCDSKGQILTQKFLNTLSVI